MNITIINDCRDENAKGRQIARTSALFNAPVNFIGVANDIEAAGNIIDILDTSKGSESVILANVAPRNGKAKRWKNGTPFCYFWLDKTLVVASIDGYTLSLVKKLKLAEFVNVLDIPTATAILLEKGEITAAEREQIINTQFRSLEFVPKIAQYLAKNIDIESEKVSIAEIPDIPKAVWWVDNFGNCKTTLLKEEKGETSFPYFERLKDVPDGETALITGSSGFGEVRFLELVIQGGNVAEKLGLSSGQSINAR
jgi:hypothetical protein